MPINFRLVVRTVMRKVSCTEDEAWDGVAEAYLSLDTTRTEREQYWWLIRCGCWAVVDSVRKQYIGIASDKRLVPSDFSDVPTPDDDEDWDFLNAFNGHPLAREFAQALALGKASYTECSVRHWLRTKKCINKRTVTRSVYEAVGVCAKRIR